MAHKATMTLDRRVLMEAMWNYFKKHDPDHDLFLQRVSMMFGWHIGRAYEETQFIFDKKENK